MICRNHRCIHYKKLIRRACKRFFCDKASPQQMGFKPGKRSVPLNTYDLGWNTDNFQIIPKTFKSIENQSVLFAKNSWEK